MARCARTLIPIAAGTPYRHPPGGSPPAAHTSALGKIAHGPVASLPWACHPLPTAHELMHMHQMEADIDALLDTHVLTAKAAQG